MTKHSFLRRLAAKVLTADIARYDPPVRPDITGTPILVPFLYDPKVSDARRAIVIHMFHSALASYFLDLAGNVPGSVDILISTDTELKAIEIKRVFEDWNAGIVNVRVTPNRGRDMLSKVYSFAEDYDRYDQILFLHSKKSDYLNGGGDNWRDVLSTGLIGSPETARSILAMYDADPKLGIVFPQHYDGIRDRLSWGGNRQLAGDLCRRMGISLASARALDFVSGSMFWARPSALAPILKLALKPDDFPEEAAQLDATLAHAIERVFLLAAELAGFTWLKTAGRGSYGNAANFLEVEGSEDLHRKMKTAAYPLLHQ